MRCGKLALAALAALALPLALASACRFPGSVRPSVRIGLVAPFEGRYRAIGYDVIYAVRLALQEANAAGGVGGYSVELAAYDDGADPQEAALQARKLALDPTVLAVIGHFRDLTTASALDVYTHEGLPLLAPAVYPSSTLPEGAPLCWLGPPPEAIAARLVQELAATNVEHAALVASDDPLTEALLRVLTSPGDGQRVEIALLHPSQSVGWAEEVAGSDTQAVICATEPVRCGEVAQALRAAGWTGPFYGGPDLGLSDFITVAGAAAHPCYYVSPWPTPHTLAGATGFIEAYRAVSNGLTPGPNALAAYEATWLLLEALERDIAQNGRPDRRGMATQLRLTPRQGLLGTVTLNAACVWADATLYLLDCNPD